MTVANDLGMLTRAGTGVALHAKPVVAAECDVRINHCNLRALLFVQGYARDEFCGLSPASLLALEIGVGDPVGVAGSADVPIGLAVDVDAFSVAGAGDGACRAEGLDSR